jgi:hypothetical protein
MLCAQAEPAGVGCGLCLRHFLPIKGHKIDWVEHERRISTMHNGPSHDLTRKRKQ